METTTQRRTLHLTERKAALCQLTPADMDFLRAIHRAHIDLVPTGWRGRCRLTPGGHVGTICAPTCRLVIRPKIPVENLFYLLDPMSPLALVEDHVAAEAGTEVLDFLASRLARLLGERVAAGLHRGYVERAEHGPSFQGQLDLAAHLREPLGRKDRLHCRYDDFTIDVPCNRLARASAERLAGLPFLNENVRAALRHALGAFATVQPLEPTPDGFAAALSDRLTEAYHPLLKLCQLLTEGLAAGTAGGSTRFPAFLIDMERVFERYVTEGVLKAFRNGSRFSAAVQPLHCANLPVPGQPDIQLRPDVVVGCERRPVLVVDAKWKRLAGSPLVTPDLHQVLAYCTTLQVGRALLVYPGRRDRVWEYSLADAPVRLEIRTTRVTGSRPACLRSLRRLGRAVRRAAAQKQ